MKELSEKYLRECKVRALAADPHKADIVIKDLRTRINKLVNHVRKLQSAIPKHLIKQQ